MFFGAGDFREIFISHTINITEIIYPGDVEKLKPAEIRELAKKKGVLKRIICADGITKGGAVDTFNTRLAC